MVVGAAAGDAHAASAVVYGCVVAMAAEVDGRRPAMMRARCAPMQTGPDLRRVSRRGARWRWVPGRTASRNRFAQLRAICCSSNL